MTGLGSIRTKKAPKKTIKCYKLLRLVDGKIYPLFIGRGEDLEFGVWYDADSPDFRHLEKLDFGNHLIDMGSGRVLESREKNPSLKEINEATANNQRWIIIKPAAKKSQFGNDKLYYNWGISKSKGKEVANSSYSLRPGWHAGELPVMNQIGIPDGNGGKLRDDSFVWVECEISADKNYQDEADANPNNDIPTHIPTDGYYEKCTNVNKVAAQAKDLSWYISGSIKFNRFISDDEAHRIIDKFNKKNGSHIVYDYPRVSGKKFNANTMSLEGVQPNLFNQHASVSGVCRNIHRPIRGIDSEELFMKMAEMRVPSGYEVEKNGKIFRVFDDGRKIYTNIIYTRDDFFKIDTKSGAANVKLVKDCLLFLKETMPKKKSLPVCDFFVDSNGDPIYLQYDDANVLLTETMKMYYDKNSHLYLAWDRDFIYGENFDQWAIDSKIYYKEDLAKSISKMNHIKSLETIKSKVKNHAKEVVDIVDERINSVKKEEDYWNRMAKKYISVYSDDVKIPKPTEKDAWACVATDENRPARCGCYNDSGFAVFTDAQILFASKSLYENKHEGKIVSKEGKVIEGKYPNWKGVKPIMSEYSKININVDDLLAFVKKHNKKRKFRRVNLSYSEYQPFYLDDFIYNPELLDKFLTVSKLEVGSKFYVKTGGKIDSVNGLLYFESTNGSWGLLMPMQKNDPFVDYKEFSPFYRDRDFGTFYDNSVYSTDKLRLAKARAKAIIIRQRQRARNNNVSGITYEMD